MQIYQTLQTQHAQQYAQLSRQYNLMSLVRVIVAVCFFVCWYAYVYVYQQFTLGLWAMASCVAIFLFLIKIHSSIGWNMRLQRALTRINEDEIAYLQHKKLPFADGAEYATTAHAYAHDLDILGKNSLFQHLNRTSTYVGKTKLANLLLKLLPTEAIQRNQEAIQELRPRIASRQAIQALGKLNEDSAQIHEKLLAWSKTDAKPVPVLVLGLSYVFPAVFWGLCAMAYLSPKPMWGGLAFLMFLVNLGVLFSQMGKIRKETQQAENIETFLKQYSTILEKIENEAFTSSLLQELQKQLAYPTGTASRQVRTLSNIFHELDSLDNVMGALLFNGSLLYHIRSWRNLMQWKAQYAPQIGTWLEVVGEIEALQSLANFAHNHESYTFPTLNTDYKISFQNVAHPLLSPETSIKNNVHFENYQFIILTGSNMSGKSTFLRTLGVNMVLASIGAPVCASEASVHPLPVWVSMRLSDSLQDSESYFFAEVKRLKEIMTAVQTQTCFVLLDEILRGTNSDDKRSGTIGVIKKMIAQRAYGAIATHDIEVCLTTADYPQMLTNKCFEVEIINNELVFDYKLREGVCQNKSATFLMEKMEII